MRIFPPSIEINDTEGFTPEKDIFKRADFGNGLAKLLQLADDPLVVVLDGPWGCGKTTFIKMLAGLLRQNGHPVVYFDAFANDFIDDAFLAIAGEVIGLSQTLKKEKTPAHKKFLDKAARAGQTIWPAPGLVDTELGVLMEPEVGHGEAEVHTRVQA